MASNILDFMVEQNQRSALQEYAKNYATMTPQERIAGLAQADPEAFRAVIAKQLDPTVQASQNQLSAVTELLKSRGGGGQPQAVSPQQPDANGITWNGPAGGSALAQVAQGVPMAQQQATAPQKPPMDDAEIAAFLAGPKDYADYLKEEPTRAKARKEASDASKAERNKYDSAIGGLQTLLGTGEDKGLVNKSIGQVGPTTTGPLGWIGRRIPGSDANDLQSNISTIQSNFGLQQLMEMKAGSPNGASGFGSLSGPELELLTSKIRNLGTNQSGGQLKENLSTIDIKGREALQKLMGDRAAMDGPRPTAMQQVAAQPPPGTPIAVNKTTGQKAYFVNGKLVPIR